MAKKILGVNETPKTKAEVTIDYMIDYIEKKVTDEERNEFAERFNNYLDEEGNVKLADLRKYFIDKYIPSLNKAKPKTKKQLRNEKVLSWLKK